MFDVNQMNLSYIFKAWIIGTQTTISNGILVIEKVPRKYTQLIFGKGYFPVGAKAQ